MQKEADYAWDNAESYRAGRSGHATFVVEAAENRMVGEICRNGISPRTSPALFEFCVSRAAIHKWLAYVSL